MSTKQDNLTDGDSCWNKAADDEPLFILRAKDTVAPEVVMHWVNLSKGVHDDAKRGDAMHVAAAMRQWRTANPPKPPAINVAALDHKSVHDALCDAIVGFVAVGEALGYGMRIDPKTAGVLGVPGATPNQLVHVAHVEQDPGPVAAMTPEQFAEAVREAQNSLQALLTMVPGALS